MSISDIKEAQKKIKDSKTLLPKLKAGTEKLLGLINSDEAAIGKLNARIAANKEELRKTNKFTASMIEQLGRQDEIIEQELEKFLGALDLDDALKDPWLPYFYKFAQSQQAAENIDFLLIKDPKKSYERFLRGKTSINVGINVSGTNLSAAHAAYAYEHEKKGDKPRANLASVITAIRNADIKPTLQDGGGVLGGFKRHASGKQAARSIAGV